MNTTGMCVRRWERALCRPRWVRRRCLMASELPLWLRRSARVPSDGQVQTRWMCGGRWLGAGSIGLDSESMLES